MPRYFGERNTFEKMYESVVGDVSGSVVLVVLANAERQRERECVCVCVSERKRIVRKEEEYDIE